MKSGLLLGFALIFLLSNQTRSENLNTSAGKISAKYNISLNGLKLGKAFFSSDVSNGKYDLKGFVKLSSAAKWILKWSGNVSTVGVMTTLGPEPKEFKYHFKSKRKTRTMDLKFLPTSAAKFKVYPPLKTHKRVPVKPEHILNALDPLSGLIYLSSPRLKMPDRKICSQRIPVFDGKERFDLIFSYKKVAKLKLSGKNTRFTGQAYVCGIKYVAVSGHKTDDEMAKFLRDERDIEVWLVPEARANIYIPAYIKIPTPLGTATAQSEVFEIDPVGKNSVTFIN